MPSRRRSPDSYAPIAILVTVVRLDTARSQTRRSSGPLQDPAKPARGSAEEARPRTSPTRPRVRQRGRRLRRASQGGRPRRRRRNWSRPETDRAIESGLAWLSKQQNSDGSYGSGAYRGNIAVTSLAGIAFMANGSSPGRGPYGPQIDKALQVCDGQYRAFGIHLRPQRGDARSDVLAWIRHAFPRRSLRDVARSPRFARS